jgi:hypothetical protein
MHLSTALLPVLGLLVAIIKGHIIMTYPPPYGISTLNNSTLINAKENPGLPSDFPCKQRTGVYEAEGADTSLALGSVLSGISFKGSAVHGGGSCQFSITYDQAPTANSAFKVIHSIEGGCPMMGIAANNGEDAEKPIPDKYSFTIPANLPAGKVTFAWTWVRSFFLSYSYILLGRSEESFVNGGVSSRTYSQIHSQGPLLSVLYADNLKFNKIGNREMYMNCAPLTLTTASKKRSEIDSMLSHNYSMIMERDTAAYNALPSMFIANIMDSTCTTTEEADLGFPNPGDSVERFGQATQPVLSPPPANCTPPPVVASVPASPPTDPTTAPVVVPPPIPTVAPPLNPTKEPLPEKATSETPASTASPASGGMAFGTACTPEGQFNCVDGTSFQQCASGSWTIVRPLAAGTSCKAGMAMDSGVVRPRIASNFKRGHRHLRI